VFDLMLHLTKVLGYVSDAHLSERLHMLSHAGRVETILLQRSDAQRHRFRTTTDRGTDVAITLDRRESLSDGAVLMLTEERAVVIRMAEEVWLSFVPCDTAAALELGYAAGNLHWRVRFADGTLQVAREGPEETYLERLRSLLTSGRVQRVTDEYSV
jgi:urease accessory protein